MTNCKEKKAAEAAKKRRRRTMGRPGEEKEESTNEAAVCLSPSLYQSSSTSYSPSSSCLKGFDLANVMFLAVQKRRKVKLSVS